MSSAFTVLKLHLFAFVFNLFIQIRTSLELNTLLSFLFAFQYLRCHGEVMAYLRVGCIQKLLRC